MATRYPVLLFDADDTLFDYQHAEAAALRAAFADAGMSCPAEWLAAYREANARTWREFEAGLLTSARLRILRFERLFAEIGCSLDPRVFGEAYLRRLAGQVTLVEGAHDLVRSLRSTHRLAIVTNGLADVQRPRLAGSSIAADIEILVVSDEVGAAKPDPAIFAEALRLLSYPPRADVLVIGDNLATDIAGGMAAGLATCWLNSAARSPGDIRRPTYEIRALGELRRVVQP